MEPADSSPLAPVAMKIDPEEPEPDDPLSTRTSPLLA
jgi:hypothetical protein